MMFDFDGTVADTTPVLISIFNKIAPLPKLSKIDSENIDWLRDLSAAEAVKKFQVSPMQILKLNKQFHDKLNTVIDKVGICKGIDKVFERLQRMKIQYGIVTSNSKENVEKFLKASKLRVDFVHSERNIFGKGKVLTKVIKQWGRSKHEAVYVGDEVRDVDAAREAGIKIMAVTWGLNSQHRLQKSNPDWLINSAEEIEKVL